jgi:molybdate transport system substrate-binding protein
MRTRLLLLLILGAVLGSPVGAAPAPLPVTVYAAASLQDALGRLGAEFTARSGVPVKFSFAASSLLARQIEAGAEADVFVSADQAWMDYLEQRGRLRPGTRRTLLGNRLALVAPADSPVALTLGPDTPLAAALGGGRLATGDPDSVPAGRYARAALTRLGLWDRVADRLVRAEDVRSALAFVARGEAPLGIVYATDARIDPRVRIVALFPEDTHPAIAYPGALTNGARAGAQAFLDFLAGARARAVFEEFGFTTPP